MARRRNPQRRRPRRRQGTSYSSITVPYAGVITPSGQANLSFNTVLPNIYSKLYESVPWRLSSVLVQFSATPLFDTSVPAKVDLAPTATCILQVLLNSAQTSNIEAISSFRSLCSPLPQRRVLRPRSPNPWKEDEQKSQYFLTLDNILSSADYKCQISFLVQIRIQFGSFTFAHKPSIWAGHIFPNDCPSTSSSPMSILDMVPEDH